MTHPASSEPENLAFLLETKPLRAMEIDQILKCIPHRYPFLLVDRVEIVEERKFAVGTKCVTVNEPFFQGHFPGKPIMPAVLILESMAQVCAATVMSMPEFKDKIGLMIGVEEAKFRRPVVPGEVLRMAINILRLGRAGKARAEAYVGNKLCAEANMSFIFADK